MPLPAGEAGPSYTTTGPPKSGNQTQSSTPYTTTTSTQSTTSYDAPAPHVIPEQTPVEPEKVLQLFQPPANVDVTESPLDFDSLFTDEQRAEMKEALGEDRRAERLDRRAGRVLERRGVMPMVNGPGVVINGQMVMTPQTNPAYAVEKAELLQRWDRKRALDPGGRKDSKEPGQRKRDKPDTEAMSWDEYNALTDAQRAAVDFNGMLVQAVRKDKKLNRTGGYDDVTDDERAVYDRTVEKLLGEDSGSRLYAPETVAMLQQIDIPDAASDLDDFLRLKVAITDKDLKRIAAWEENATAEEPTVDETGRGNYELAPTEALEDRTQMQLEFADATTDLQQSLAEGNQLLATWRQTAMMARNEDLQYYGGDLNSAKVPIGFEPPKFSTDAYGNAIAENAAAYFQIQFDNLANAAGDQNYINQVLSDTRAMLEPRGQLQDFYNYIDIKSKQAEQFGGYSNPNPNVQYRSPEEFRKVLGLSR
jgi:hypothetical protein